VVALGWEEVTASTVIIMTVNYHCYFRFAVNWQVSPVSAGGHILY